MKLIQHFFEVIKQLYQTQLLGIINTVKIIFLMRLGFFYCKRKDKVRQNVNDGL